MDAGSFCSGSEELDVAVHDAPGVNVAQPSQDLAGVLLPYRPNREIPTGYHTDVTYVLQRRTHDATGLTLDHEQ